jgi:hypothetical protein
MRRYLGTQERQIARRKLQQTQGSTRDPNDTENNQENSDQKYKKSNDDQSIISGQKSIREFGSFSFEKSLKSVNKSMGISENQSSYTKESFPVKREINGQSILPDIDEEDRLGGEMYPPCNEADNQNCDVSAPQWNYDQWSGAQQYGYDDYSRGYEGQGYYQGAPQERYQGQYGDPSGGQELYGGYNQAGT